MSDKKVKVSNTVVLSKRWSHHTPSGGYDRLCNNLKSKIYFSPRFWGYSRYSKLLYSVWKRLLPSSKLANDYRLYDLITELKVILMSWFSKISVVFSIYGEDQLNFTLSKRNFLNSALVATFHLPADNEIVRRKIEAGKVHYLKRIDAAIVLSKTQVEDYEKLIGKGKVHFIPHGIDTTVFSPPDYENFQPGDNLNVLFVGGHIRDWDTIEKVIQYYQGQKSNISFTALLNSWHVDRLSSYPNVKIVSQIPERELIELYRSSHVLFMPVVDATANNAILESLACGTPVISTNVGGIPDYVDEHCGWLFEQGDIDGIMRLFDTMLQNSAIYLSKRKPAREQALKFDWKQVAKEVSLVYKEAYKQWKSNKS